MRKPEADVSAPADRKPQVILLDTDPRVGQWLNTGVMEHVQKGGKVTVATTGGSPIKPTEVALLEVDSVAALTKAAPDDWQVLKKATKAEVSRTPLFSLLCKHIIRGGRYEGCIIEHAMHARIREGSSAHEHASDKHQSGSPRTQHRDCCSGEHAGSRVGCALRAVQGFGTLARAVHSCQPGLYQRRPACILLVIV